MLARYGGVTPEQIEMSRGLYGKPRLASPALGLDFNLSHSGDWWALAVSDGAAVGIDLEYCDPGRDVLKLARRSFCAAELADLEACPPALRNDRFYDYWTLKEAHIKAGGGSLGRELEATGFALSYPGATSGGEVTGSIAKLAPVTAAGAWYCLLQPIADYRLALCYHAPRGTTPVLGLFESPLDAPRTPPLRAVSAVGTSAARQLCD